jgi:hypothetical protein
MLGFIWIIIFYYFTTQNYWVFGTGSIVRYSRKQKTRRFGKWICFRPCVKGEDTYSVGSIRVIEISSGSFFFSCVAVLLNTHWNKMLQYNILHWNRPHEGEDNTKWLKMKSIKMRYLRTIKHKTRLATGWTAEGLEFESRWRQDIYANPTSYPMGIVSSFFGGKSAGAISAEMDLYTRSSTRPHGVVLHI